MDFFIILSLSNHIWNFSFYILVYYGLLSNHLWTFLFDLLFNHYMDFALALLIIISNYFCLLISYAGF